jgi:hypothetical protein
VASSRVKWLDGKRTNVLRNRSVLVIRNDDYGMVVLETLVRLHDAAACHRKFCCT